MWAPCKILILFSILYQSGQSYKQPVENSLGKRPNITLIITDNMGYSGIGCYGSEIQTPVLDGLASAGIKCIEFYIEI